MKLCARISWRRWRAAGLSLVFAVLALNGVSHAVAQGLSYEKGLRAFEAGDLSTAYNIWRQLAEDGDTAAEYGVGVILERGGGGIDPDVEEAAQWYRRAAEKGLASAQNNLGLLYARGRGVPRNPERAVELWQQASQQGHHMAEYNLGLAYYRGAGIGEDRVKARDWFEAAAQGGLADAQFALGQLYRMGIGTQKDQEKALAWYERAAEQGHPDARRYAEELRSIGVAAATIEESPDTVGESTEMKEPTQSASSAGAPAQVEREPQSVAQPAPQVEAQPQPEPQPEPQAEPVTEPVAEPEPQSATATQSAARTVNAGADGYHVWLASARSPDAAETFWANVRGRAPSLGEAGFQVREVNHGGGEVFYRVLAGPFTSRADAVGLCQEYRAGESDAFCKIVR